jgi:geranylgeranyl reductase family protein
VIVGGGPAGATAARTLALDGARVRVLERARFPRNKPCGGAISMRALRRFPYLASAIESIPTRFISRLHLESPGGESVELQSSTPAALMIRRVEFDEMLVRLAEQAGAEFVEGCEVTQVERTPQGICLTTRQGERITAPWVIAADGANSVVARRLGMNAGWKPASVALDMMEETPFESLACADPDLLWVAYGYGRAHGYAYVFPKREHVNVGVGFLLDHFRDEIDEAPYTVQKRFVGHLRAAGVLAGSSDRRRFTPALIPVGGPLKRTVDGRVLLIGDAGGFVNGFSAEGIYYAMVSGELAGRALVAGTPESFDPAWRQEVGEELRDSVLVQRFLFGDLGRIDRLVKGARENLAAATEVINYAMGHISYRHLRARFIMRSPLIALRLLATSLS